ncbi:DUF1572 family protein [Virgibacillus sp. YIM 98842]|uniref:DUF1572 family protein n=1 Tax=Virgibacillus sp. YIM 98842 TaxID=2663533 RepID=UPI0013D902F2|nr:DUF1572 family protein [Virgibacillus sp. YIM 98842]
MTIGKEYIKVIHARFNSVKQLGDKAIEQLSDEELHWTANDTSNNIAIIVKHMSGNMISRWTDFLITDGEKPDRSRDKEFIDTLLSKTDITDVWNKGWNVLFDALDALVEENLLETITIRGEAHSVIDAIERQLAHYSYHVGQIVYIGKMIKNESWENLSIPAGKSEEYLREMLDKHRK